MRSPSKPSSSPAARAPREALARDLLARGQARPETAQVKDVLFHPGLPVDVRHNAKIRRELLATWAAEQLGSISTH